MAVIRPASANSTEHFRAEITKTNMIYSNPRT